MQVTEVVQKDVPIYIELVGATLGSQDIEIRSRVEGYLVSMNFIEGSFVKKGQLLYRIDPQPLEAALAETKADLATAHARLEKTNNDVARYRPLVPQQAISQQELDNALSAQQAAKAQVEAFDAKLAKAKLDLNYTSITSPIDGLIGTTQKRVGSLVGAQREHAAYHGIAGQPDPVSLRDCGGGISKARQAQPAEWQARGEANECRTDPCGRNRLSAQRSS